MKNLYFALFLLLASQLVFSQNEVDILIVGGGTGGTSAAIQAARMGAKVQIIEATPWLGGMLTSAGVSAIDGNHEMPSGIWGEFRQKLRTHYGGAKALATGWVSHTLFEPSVGNNIFQKMANIDNLTIAFNAKYTSIKKEDQKWIVSYIQRGKTHSTSAKILIDATELGELLPIVDAEFRLGMDSKLDTQEEKAPAEANTIVQDITYVLILEDIGTKKGSKGLVKKPKNYTPSSYECACKRENSEMFGGVSNCEQMLNYGKLPSKKYMINWPNCGNDFFLHWPELSINQRQIQLKEAKDFTLGFVYYIQNELGYKNLRVANEFPTKDQFPMIPYDREARRLKGKAFLTVNHLEKPYDYNFYKTGIAVGDYPIDHHRDKNPKGTHEIDFINIRVPSYNIPIGSLIPEVVENFIVAEKNISVSNIVNGASRLQPVVLGIGQAAGALAAIAIQDKLKPSEVFIRKVQNALLDKKAYIMPYIDIKPDEEGFTSIQRIGASGILKGIGIPYKWANQTWFYPDQIVSEHEWKIGMLQFYPQLEKIAASGQGITLKFFHDVINKLTEDEANSQIVKKWNDYYTDQNLDNTTPLNRRKTSIITDQIFDPFSINIDFKGNLLSN